MFSSYVMVKFNSPFDWQQVTLQLYKYVESKQTILSNWDNIWSLKMPIELTVPDMADIPSF